jgi:hypothetical protein
LFHKLILPRTAAFAPNHCPFVIRNALHVRNFIVGKGSHKFFEELFACFQGRRLRSTGTIIKKIRCTFFEYFIHVVPTKCLHGG